MIPKQIRLERLKQFRITKNLIHQTYNVELLSNKSYMKNNDLDLSNSDITILPENLYVPGLLNLMESKIKKLPNNLWAGDIVLEDCLDLESIGDNTIINNDVCLADLDLLTHIGSGLFVDYLYIGGCPKLTRIPEDIYIYKP